VSPPGAGRNRDILAPVTVFAWQLDGLAMAATLIAGGLYALGIRTMRAGGHRWPAGRTASFAAGLVVIVLATQSAIAVYDTTLFSVHTVQHLLLGLVAPMLLVLGAPIALALQSSPRPIQTKLVGLIRSRPVEVLTHPLVVWLLFAGSMFVLYLTPLYDVTLRNVWIHQLVHAHMLFIGSLFFVLVVGNAPLRWRIPHPMRLLFVLLLVPIHAVLGIAIMNADPVIGSAFYTELGREWGPSLAGDQLIGGGVLWAGHELMLVALLLLVVSRWLDAEDRMGRRYDRRMAARS
jgi:putative membrane protein